MPWVTMNGAHVLIGEDGEPVAGGPTGSSARTSETGSTPKDMLYKPGGGKAWAPSMTAAEADAWASESVIQDTLYHYTRTQQNVKGIQKEGFHTPAEGGQAYWGQGVYMYQNPEPDGNSNWGDKEIQTRVNVGKVLEVPNEGSEAACDRLAAEAKKAYPNDNRRVAIRKHLQDQGYDAIRIEGTAGWMGGGKQVVVFDPKNVTVVKGGRKRSSIKDY